ncbi:UNKNOWN [Stylonychia lemnae]|uniref:Uncharacterized protein n=1 Tax=Stylonychia lemnae TaxID=5949 RepID=A0A078ARP3_STYLE|nr:UNKNOWN [Stylonychia lemnae]|eukprot:CDW84651.1 UNKNOWN [Stylonychia lemnae]
MSLLHSMNQTPGPGTYQAEKYRSQARISYSMARKYDIKDRMNVPGPGTYKGKSFLDDKKPNSFPLAMKDNVLINKERLKTPGPGVYEQKTQLSKIGHFITPARPITDKGDRATNPGPGTYTQIAQLYNRGNNIVIGNERGREQVDKEKNSIPGPGIYKPEAQRAIYKSTGNIPIGNAARKPLLHESALANPGPGNYDQSIFKKGTKAPAYGIGTGPKEAIDFSTAKTNPGPGIYSQAVKRTKIGAAIGNDTRFKEKPSGVPGPGSYALKSSIGAVAAYHGINRQ